MSGYDENSVNPYDVDSRAIDTGLPQQTAMQSAEEQKLQDEKLKHAADNLVKLGLAPRGTFASKGNPQELDKAELHAVLDAVQGEMQKQGAVKGASMDQVYTVLDKTVAEQEDAVVAAAKAEVSREPEAKPQAQQQAAAPVKSAPAKVAAPTPSIPFRDEDMVMQAQLRMLGEAELSVDGRKGPKTNAAMESFARKNGLNGADEKAVRTKINEQYTALRVTPARVDDLVTSGNSNDVRAGQVAYNLQHPNAQIKVSGLDNEVKRTAYATHTPVAAPVTSAGSVVMATAATPPTVTAPEYTQSISRAPAQVQQQVYGGTYAQQPMTAQPPAGAALQQYPQPVYNTANAQVGQRGGLAPAFTGQASGGVIVRDQATGIAYNPYTGQYMNPNTGHAINPGDRNRDGKIDGEEYRTAVNADNLQTNGTYVTRGNMSGGVQPVLAPWTNGYPNVKESAYARQDNVRMYNEDRRTFSLAGRAASGLLDTNPRNNGQAIGTAIEAALGFFRPKSPDYNPDGPRRTPTF